VNVQIYISQLHALALLPQWNESPAPIRLEARWVPELVWPKRQEDISCPYRDSNSNPSTIQPRASHYTNCIILVPFTKQKINVKIKVNML
jgi:hypothetical protein